MDAKLKESLVKLFGTAAVEVGNQMMPVYGGAIAQMTVTELLALDDFVRAKDFAKAQDAIRAKMTAEELAAEKAGFLADLTRRMAEDQAAAWSMARELALAGLKVLLAIAVAGVGF